jgi:hypothetical protein
MMALQWFMPSICFAVIYERHSILWRSRNTKTKIYLSIIPLNKKLVPINISMNVQPIFRKIPPWIIQMHLKIDELFLLQKLIVILNFSIFHFLFRVLICCARNWNEIWNSGKLFLIFTMDLEINLKLFQ